ncbi:MAG TPA: putative O-glycosylation ligase, exosortase A system-associated [Stellaceae bacterium]|nr:putative O-glycosylation ligase, exosortase A system-associated [Stellaceae bacterium]
MLRQVLFVLAYLGLLPAIIPSPFTGVLIYKWLEYLPPDSAYSVSVLPDRLSFTVAGLTFLFWLIREKKTLPQPPLLMVMLVVFFVWINLTTWFALVPAAAEFKWDRTVKVIGFALLTAQMMRSRSRIEAFIWVQVICVAYSAIPGAIKTVLTGGGGEVVVGVPGSFIDERVAFAVSLPIIAPLALFLANHATLLPASRWLKRALQGIAASCIISLVGTFARTALFSGGAALLMLTLKSKRKLLAALTAGVVVLFCFEIAPETWLQRMDTTVNYQNDGSAESRIASWQWSWNFALEHPFLGGGFRVETLNHVPGTAPGSWLESHNILFEVMAEHGFVGLALFCGLIGLAYRSCGVASRRARERPDLAWAADLARTVQAGLVVFVAGGMFISVASSPFLYDLVAITISLRSLVERETAKEQVRGRVPGRETAGMLPAQ